MHRSSAIQSVFILSGAAGLIYEVVWSRQLVLVFGNTTQAVSAILTGFFGGMAIGAFFGGRLADRIRRPLRMYGIIELIVVVVVLATPFTFGLIHEAYRGFFSVLEDWPPVLAVVRLILALLALAPATILMGATLPTLTRYLTSSTHLSDAFGRLYLANTMGAILGTLVAGLFLIELFGLYGAVISGAVCSAVAGLIALWLSRTDDRGEVTASSPTPAASDVRPVQDQTRDRGVDRRTRLALTIAFVSGLTSLGYQVLWTRLLASGTGNRTYVFTVILAIFLFGLAIGSLTFNLIRDRIKDPIRLLAGIQFAVAALVLLGLVGVLVQPHGITPADPFESLRSLARGAVIVVLPVTILMGLAFPTASALLADDSRHAGRESGKLLAYNTIGAIAGSLIVPFALIPFLGSPTVVALLAIVNVALGIGLAVVGGMPRRFTVAAGGVMMVALVGSLVLPGFLVQPNDARIRAEGGRVFESREDEIASVQAGQIIQTPELWVAGTSMTLLTIDAKLMPVLPLIARPEAHDALVVAFGMGSAYRAALIAGLHTTGVELVPSVPAMFGWYYPDAAAVLANPNGRVIVADGRNHLELTGDRYDIIITDPPPPIESSGASVISSLEYYQAGRDHLNPGGVMMQWVPYGAPDADFRDHVRTFATVFPQVTMVRGAGGYGVYMLGSTQPISFPPDAIRATLALPGVLADISSAYDSPATTVDGWITVIAKQTWLSGTAVSDYAGPGPLITDDHPRPEYFLLRLLTTPR